MQNNQVTIEQEDICWNFEKNGSLEKSILGLQQVSELRYINVVEDIVRSSTNQLFSQHRSKSKIRKWFLIFFVLLLLFQILSVIAIIFVSAIFKDVNISDTIIITYISTIFVETLGEIGVMVKFSFDDSKEVQILQILNGAISNFQKFENKN